MLQHGNSTTTFVTGRFCARRRQLRTNLFRVTHALWAARAAHAVYDGRVQASVTRTDPALKSETRHNFCHHLESPASWFCVVKQPRDVG